MVDRKNPPVPLMVALALVLWFVYFVVCSAPVGAPFIYVDF